MNLKDSAFVKIQRSESNDLVVVFSSINTPAGRFRFSRQLSEWKTNAIYLNCENNSWYLNGVPGLGDSLEEARSSLNRLISTEFPSCRVFGLGSSMGASGLIGMLCDTDVERAFAFCPEVDLFRSHSFSTTYFKGTPSPQKNLFEEFGRFKSLRVFYGEECEPDLGQVKSLLELGATNIQTVAEQGHGVVEALHLTEGLSGVLGSLTTGEPLTPRVLRFGDIQENAGACNLLWRCYLSKPGASKAALVEDLEKYIARTAVNRSYYPQLLYWLIRYIGCNERREQSSWQAFLGAPYSLRIAHQFFATVGSASAIRENYKRQFFERFGQSYVENDRAKLFHEIK